MNVMDGADRERKRRFWCVRIPIAFVLPFQTWESDGYMKAAVEVDSICTQLPTLSNSTHEFLTYHRASTHMEEQDSRMYERRNKPVWQSHNRKKRRRMTKSNGDVQSSSMRTTPFIQHQRCLELISVILNPGSRSGILWIHKLSNQTLYTLMGTYLWLDT